MSSAHLSARMSPCALARLTSSLKPLKVSSG
jgi:hypothetical protein